VIVFLGYHFFFITIPLHLKRKRDRKKGKRKKGEGRREKGEEIRK